MRNWYIKIHNFFRCLLLINMKTIIVLLVLFLLLLIYFLLSSYTSSNKKKKVAYIILTCQKYTPTRVEYQKETFLKNVDKDDIYYLSSIENKNERIFGWNTEDNYESCPLKYIRFFQKIDLSDKYYFYAFIDDDTFVNTKNINEYLSTLDSKNNLLIGYKWTHLYPSFPHYMSGGAGIFITNSVYKNVKEYVRNSKEKDLMVSIYGDVCIGKWIYNSYHNDNVHDWNRVKLVENKDFHPFYKTDGDDIENFLTFHYVDTREKFLELNSLCVK